MVREVNLVADFPQCTPKEFFDIIYADEVSTKIYHKLNSSEEGAEVSQWSDNTRTVEFFKEIELPSALSYLFSSNKLPVKEVQTLEHHEDGGFSVLSTPELQINVGPTFKGTTKVSVRTKGVGSEASGPWGMVNFIEGYMADEAKAGVESFLVFCETRIAESKMDMASLSEEDSENLEFHDVQYETLSQSSFPERPILESRDSNGMLTTEALILKRVKQLEAELKISKAGMESIAKKVEALETSLLKSRQNTKLALMGCSALSIALVATVIVLKRQNA